MRNTVLVTGGAGYIGSHACKSLALCGFTPVTLDNLSTGRRDAVRWGPLEVGDLLDAGALHEVVARHRPVAVMHFAAFALVGELVAEPARYWRNNVVATVSLLDACRTHGVRNVIFSSTCAVYGIPAWVPVAEDSPRLPINPYGASKLAAERAVEDYASAYGVRAATLRYFNAAGADPDGEAGETREVETHLIPLALDAALGRGAPIQILGDDYPTDDGTAIRDYIHVSDLADAHVAALDHLLADGPTFVANLGVGRGYSVREVVAAVARVTELEVPCELAPRRPGDPPRLVADAARARKLLGVSFPRSQGLDEIIETAWRWRSKGGPQRLGSARSGPDRSNGHAPPPRASSTC